MVNSAFQVSYLTFTRSATFVQDFFFPHGAEIRRELILGSLILLWISYYESKEKDFGYVEYDSPSSLYSSPRIIVLERKTSLERKRRERVQIMRFWSISW